MHNRDWHSWVPTNRSVGGRPGSRDLQILQMWCKHDKSCLVPSPVYVSDAYPPPLIRLKCCIYSLYSHISETVVASVLTALCSTTNTVDGIVFKLASMGDKVTLKLSLDWTPNGNHAGIFVALGKNWYADQGIDLQLVSPHSDAYENTPASRVCSGSCDLAITPSETVISNYCKPEDDPGKADLVAVAAILQEDDSAVVTLKESGIDSMKKLEGKKYASYGARYEGRIIQEMIKNDGGSGDYLELTPKKLGLWDAVINGECDATWVFMGWEGQEAKLNGIDLNVFKLKDYGVEYGYPLVMVAKREIIQDGHAASRLHSFLHQTAKGYIWAKEHPQDAAELMLSTCKDIFPDFPMKKELVNASVIAASTAYLDEQGKWGGMTKQRWDSFLDWLSKNSLLTTKMQSRDPDQAHKTTLDGLRQGDSGDSIPRERVNANDLFTNLFSE